MTRGTYFQLFSGVGLRLTLWLYRVRILCSCHNFKKERFLPYFLLQLDPWRLKFGSVCSQRLALSSWRRVILHSVRLLEEYCCSLPLSPGGVHSAPAFPPRWPGWNTDTRAVCWSTCPDLVPGAVSRVVSPRVILGVIAPGIRVWCLIISLNCTHFHEYAQFRNNEGKVLVFFNLLLFSWKTRDN